MSEELQAPRRGRHPNAVETIGANTETKPEVRDEMYYLSQMRSGMREQIPGLPLSEEYKREKAHKYELRFFRPDEEAQIVQAPWEGWVKVRKGDSIEGDPFNSWFTSDAAFDSHGMFVSMSKGEWSPERREMVPDRWLFARSAYAQKAATVIKAEAWDAKIDRDALDKHRNVVSQSIKDNGRGPSSSDAIQVVDSEMKIGAARSSWE